MMRPLVFLTKPVFASTQPGAGRFLEPPLAPPSETPWYRITFQHKLPSAPHFYKSSTTAPLPTDIVEISGFLHKKLSSYYATYRDTIRSEKGRGKYSGTVLSACRVKQFRPCGLGPAQFCHTLFKRALFSLLLCKSKTNKWPSQTIQPNQIQKL